MSSAAILIRIGQNEGVSSISIAAYRLSIAALVLSAPVVRQRGWREYATLKPKQRGLLITSGILLGLHFASWVTSLEGTTVASSVVLVTTTPIWIAIASPFLLGERTQALTWVGIAVAFGGGLIISVGGLEAGGASTLRGDALALAGALFAAGYLMAGRASRDVIGLTTYLWMVYGVAALFLLGWALLAGQPMWGFSRNAWLALLGLGLIPQLIGHSAANYAMRTLSATFVSITILGEPIGSTVLAFFLLGERPALHHLVGGALILVGVGVTAILEERRKQRQKLEATTTAP
jgi:drug/metabolite transporter (DMT)-like permease